MTRNRVAQKKAARLLSKAAEEGVAAAQRTFAKIMEKADPAPRPKTRR